MADEPLIMRAGISYDPTPLNQLKRQLDSLKSGSAAVIRKDFEEVRGSVSKAAAEIRNSLTPAMAAMGLGSLGVGAAITGVVAAVKSLTSGLTEMRMASKETGATVQELRELQALARRFDINPDAMSGGVMAFSDTMRQIKNKWGETYEWMRTASPEMAELGKKLFNAKNMDEALESAMAGISGIANPKVRQMLAEKLFGSRLFSQLGAEGAKSFEEIRAEIHKRIVALPPDADKVAREFKESMDQIGDAAVNLQTQFAKALLPVLPEIKAGIDEFTAFLRTEKKEISAFFTEVVTDARTFVHDLQEHFDNLRAGYEGAKNFFGGSQTGGATHGILPEASIGETVANPEIASRRLQMDELRRQHAILEERIARKESEPDPMGGEGHAVAAEERRRLDKLNEELKRLSDEIQALRHDTATVQQQSFNGGGFGGMVQNASFGGGGLGGGGRGYAGGGERGGGRAGSSAGGGYGLNREGVERAGRAARQGATGSPEMPALANDPMLDLIGRTEGTDKGRGYNETLAYGKLTGGPRNLTGMSLDEIDKMQTEMLHNPANHWNSSAAGRYQIVRTTLRRLRDQLHLKGSDLYDPEMQDRLGRRLLQGRGRNAAGLRNEWESFRRLSDDQIYGAWDRRTAMAKAGTLGRHDAEAPRAPEGWFGKTMGVLGGGKGQDPKGSVNISLDGFPRGVRARTSMEGLFKEMSLTRGRSMESSEAI